MPSPSTFRSLLDAVDCYFDLMFDSDVSHFDGSLLPNRSMSSGDTKRQLEDALVVCSGRRHRGR